MKARIILADDHEVVRQGLRDILALTSDMEVVAEARDGNEAERLARTVAADLLVLDIAMPGKRGLAVLESLRTSGVELPVLVFTMYGADQYANFCRRAGAQGFVSKDARSQTVLAALRSVLSGEEWFGGASAAGPEDPFAALSTREREVALGMLRGESLAQIAQQMQIGTKSVSTYRTRLLAKLHLNSNVELAALATRTGFL